MHKQVRGVARLDYSHRVLGEMDESLERIRQLTIDVVEHTGDQFALELLLSAVSQSHNTFNLIECFGAELLTAELESLLLAIHNGSLDEHAEPAPVLVLASEKLIEYIEYLKAGGQDLPLALLTLVNNMRACRGVGLLSEALIVSPHFQIPEVTVQENVDPQAEKEFFKVVRRTRLPLMRNLLSWFKQPDKENIQALVSAFANLQIASPSAEMRSLWAAARALAASIGNGGLQSSAAIKMLLGQLERFLQRLDQQTRLHADPEFPSNLFKNLLYYVALSTSDETSVVELKKQYRLSELLPPRSSLEQARGALGGPGARLSEAICNSLGQELSEVRSVLDSVTPGNAIEGMLFDDTLQRLKQVSYTLLLLGLNHARILNDRAVAQLKVCRDQQDYSDLQAVAADILRVDAELEEYLHGNGRPAVFADDFTPQEAASEQLSSYQYNLIVEKCLAEACRSLQSVQANYLSALADWGRRSQLLESSEVLESVANALQILPLPELKPLLGGAAVYLRELVKENADNETGNTSIVELPVAFEQQRFAVLLVCSELYLDSALQRQAAAADLLVHADEALNSLLGQTAEHDMTLANTYTTNSAMSPAENNMQQDVGRDMMAVFIDEALDAYAAINQQLANWKQQRGTDSLENLRRQFHTLKGSGMVAGAPSISAFAAANEEMLSQYIDEQQGGSVASDRSNTLETLLNESSAVLPQLINQLSHPAQEGLQEIEGLDELVGRIHAASVKSSPIATDMSSTSAMDIFDQTIATHTTVDEFSQTLSMQEEVDDMTRTVSMHDLGDGDFTRTVAMNVGASSSGADVSKQVGNRAASAEYNDDADFTRTVAMHEPREFAHTAALHQSSPAESTGPAQSPNQLSDTLSDPFSDPLPDAFADQVSDPVLDQSLSATATQVLAGSNNEDTATYSLDNTLLRVFYSECLTHVALLKEMLTPSALASGSLPSAEMQRSLHTMRGSAHTADVPGVAKLVGPLEDLANAKLAATEQFNRSEFDLVKDAVFVLEMQIDALSEGRPLPPSVTEMEIRLGEFSRQAKQVASGSKASNDLQELYIEEATELLNNIHASISSLRQSDDQLAHANRLRADLHTLKGGARVAQFNAIADITHALEGALSRWINELPLSAVHMDKLQEVADAITVNLDQARSGGSLGQFDWLISELKSDRFAKDKQADSTAGEELFELTQLLPEPPDAADATTDLTSDVTAAFADMTVNLNEPEQQQDSSVDADLSALHATSGSAAPAASDLIRLDAAAIARLSELSTEVSIHQARVGDYLNDLRDSLIDLDKTTDRLRYKLRDLQRETDSTLSFLESTLDLDSGTDATSRLDPADLERFTRRREDSRQLSEILADFDAIRTRLHERMRGSQETLSLTSRIGSDIQQSLMRSQLIRFGQHTQRLSSTIRQTATALNKSVDWDLQGGDCSIDRSLHKDLLVPLEHLIRNAIAHGIEDSAERSKQGKPAAGNLELSVKFDGNDLVISVADDGAGVDFPSLRQRLGKELSDQEILDSLFKSGLTTVSKPNQYAGRGVGLDVVERALAGLNGSVSISSEQGRGTTVTLRIPQRVVIHQVVLVELEDSVFGIPVNNVHTVLAVENEESVNFNGQDYATHRLCDLLGQPQPSRGHADRLGNQAILIEAGGQRVALRVNEVPGYRELIARPLGRQISSLKIYTGGSILANGQSVLILDLNRLLSETEARLASSAVREDSREAGTAEILVVDDSVTMRTYAERILSSKGYTAEFARDGIEALERLREFTPDLMLLDIEMPRMDGFELLEKLRANPQFSNLPVVIVSSRSSMQHRRRASELGVQSYVVKPYREEELIRLLERMTGVIEV